MKLSAEMFREMLALLAMCIIAVGCAGLWGVYVGLVVFGALILLTLWIDDLTRTRKT